MLRARCAVSHVRCAVLHSRRTGKHPTPRGNRFDVTRDALQVDGDLGARDRDAPAERGTQLKEGGVRRDAMGDALADGRDALVATSDVALEQGERT